MFLDTTRRRRLCFAFYPLDFCVIASSSTYFFCLSSLSYCLPVCSCASVLCMGACVCVCLWVCVCVLLKGEKPGGCTMGTPGPDTSLTIRESLLSFLFDFLLANQSSLRQHRQDVLDHYMMDKWTGRLKTKAENVRIHSLIYFRLWKYTPKHT